MRRQVINGAREREDAPAACVAPIMTIIALRPWLLAAASDESEAVAVSCVEFLLAETNAYYEQHVLARDAVRAGLPQLRCGWGCSDVVPQ